MPERKEIHVGGSMVGNAVIGDQNKIGDVVVGPSTSAQDVRELLATLRAEVAAKDDATPKKESVLEAIEELDAEVAKDEPSEPVTRHLLGKLSDRLVGGLAVATSLTELAEKVKGLFA